MAATAFPPSVRGRPCYYDKWRVAHCAKQGEHIVFMGDSLTRYQWVALAASFHEGVELSNAEFPSLVKERGFGPEVDVVSFGQTGVREEGGHFIAGVERGGQESFGPLNRGIRG